MYLLFVVLFERPQHTCGAAWRFRMGGETGDGPGTFRAEKRKSPEERSGLQERRRNARNVFT